MPADLMRLLSAEHLRGKRDNRVVSLRWQMVDAVYMVEKVQVDLSQLVSGQSRRLSNGKKFNF